MNYLDKLVKELANEIIKHRRYNYSQEALYNFAENNPHTSITPYKIQNKRSQNLQAIIFKNNNNKSTTCIVYAHGLGSNKIQILPILQCLKYTQYDVCAFDFSGSGRSEGDKTTYGLQEQDDVLSILSWLDQLKEYDKYVLWGRSMGAVSIILSQSRHFNPKVQCMVLDSPFSSFEKVAIELASKKSMIPQFMLEICVDILKKHLQQNHEFNPFSINVCDHIKNIRVQILLMYSKIDNVVSFGHSKNLKQFCLIAPVEIQLQQDHNTQRNKQTINQIISFIQVQIRTKNRLKRGRSQSKNRGISLTSKDQNSRLTQNQKLLCNKTSKLQLNKNRIISTTFRDYNYTQTVNTSFSFNSQIPISLNQTFQGSHASKPQIRHIKPRSVYLKPHQMSLINKKLNLNDVETLGIESKLNWFVNKENNKPQINYLRKNRFK